MIVGQPTTLTFSLVAPSGVTYQSPVVTVDENPWGTSSTLTDNGNGTYSITITPDRETKRQVILKVLDAGKTYYHALDTTATDEDDMKLGVTNSTNYTPAGGPMYLYFNFLNKSGTKKLWNLSPAAGIIDQSSLKVSTDKSFNLTNLSSGNNGGSLPDAYLSATLAWPAGVDECLINWEFDATHVLSGVKRHYSYKTPAYKGITGTFVTNETLYVGIEKLVQFTLKYASGNAPTDIRYRVPHTITGGTVTSEIITIDAAAGLYGVKVTPTSTSVTLTVNYVVGNSQIAYQCGPKTFAAVPIATPTLPAMAKYTRNIGIVLKDAGGFITDATITKVAAGSYIDESVGSWTAYDGAKGLYRVPVIGSTRGMPTSGLSATSKSTDTVMLTFTRGGVTSTVPMSIDIYWNNAQVAVSGAVSTGGAVTLTPVAGSEAQTASWTYDPPLVLGLDGVQRTTGGAITNNIGTAGTLTWTAPVLSIATDNVVWTSASNGRGTSFAVWSESFSVQHQYSLTWSPIYNRQNVNTGQWSVIPAFDFTDIEVTITDDLGALVTDAYIVESPAPVSDTGRPAASAIWARSGMTTWRETMVPKTDGSDGKYLLKLHWNTYNDVNNMISFWIPTVRSPSRNAQTALRMNFGINRNY